MSIKTYIILAIFTGILLAYVMYMSKEITTSKQKLEAFQEATSRESTINETKQPPAVVPTQPPAVVPTQPPAVVPTQPPAVVPTQPPAVVPTQPPAVIPTPTPTPVTKSTKQKEDLEKSLFIIAKYEEIYGSKIGPEELDQLSAEFANVDDRDVITYKLKELKYKTNEEVDAIFELTDVSQKLQDIVTKMKGKAINILSQNVENKGELKNVEGFMKGPKYTAYNK